MAPRLWSVLLVGALALSVVLVPTSAGQDTNTWSGTWVNSAPDGSFWVFAETGAGGVGGVWKGSAASGTITGTLNGDTLSGTLVNNEANQSGYYSITLAPDGHSFSGTFTIGQTSGAWRSTCTEGKCLSNTGPAPPQPEPPTVLPAASAWGKAGPATSLGPGGGAIATSPKLGSDQHSVAISLTGDRSGETAVVIGPVRHTQNLRVKTPGDCVRVALNRANEERKLTHEVAIRYGEFTNVDDTDTRVVDFTLTMIACLDALKERESQAGPAAAGAVARASCKVSVLPISVRRDRRAKTIRYSSRKASKKDLARLLRTSCQRGANGTVTLRISTKSRRTKLRDVLGPRLVAGAYHSSGASGAARVRAKFTR